MTVTEVPEGDDFQARVDALIRRAQEAEAAASYAVSCLRAAQGVILSAGLDSSDATEVLALTGRRVPAESGA